MKIETGRRAFEDHPLVQLTLVRFREFRREPEAVFWVFIFPILLAAGLGIAFRNRPAEVVRDLRARIRTRAPGVGGFACTAYRHVHVATE